MGVGVGIIGPQFFYEDIAKCCIENFVKNKDNWLFSFATIADPIDAVHLAIGAEIAPKRYLVAVVRHEVMAAWVARAEASGLRNAAMVPDADGVPAGLDAVIAKTAGEAMAAIRGATVIDAIVMASAARRDDVVYTSDVGDLTRLQAFFPQVRLFAA